MFSFFFSCCEIQSAASALTTKKQTTTGKQTNKHCSSLKHSSRKTIFQVLDDNRCVATRLITTGTKMSRCVKINTWGSEPKWIFAQLPPVSTQHRCVFERVHPCMCTDWWAHTSTPDSAGQLPYFPPPAGLHVNVDRMPHHSFCHPFRNESSVAWRWRAQDVSCLVFVSEDSFHAHDVINTSVTC